MRIALGVGGGIAAYKSAELIRALDKAGCEVRVVLTRNGARFITPLTLQTLSRNPVITDAWDLAAEGVVRHVELTREIDALAVAPATADLLAKFARGIADDFLSTLYCATVAPVVVAPAMNTRMWAHPATRENVAVLRRRGVRVVEPEHGWLAEREDGVGRLAEPATIAAAILESAAASSSLAGRTIVVTAGPTREPIDPVRYLSNRSSGKMGYALAAAAQRRGARVVLISGPVDLGPPFGVRVVAVRTAEEMRRAVLDERAGAFAVFMVAAVADFAPQAAAAKIKKSVDPRTLTLHPTPDILEELGRTKGAEILVGFAAETEHVVESARGKLARKNADFVVANDVSAGDVGMDADDNAVTIVGRDGRVLEVPRSSKAEVAEAILDHVFAGRAS